MFGDRIFSKNSVKYLGMHVTNNRHFYKLSESITDMKVRTNVTTSNFKCLDHCSKASLFNSHCLCLYGSCLWDLDDPLIKTVEVTWRKCSRQILKLPPRTHCRFIPYIMKTPDMIQILHQRKLNFILSGINHNNNFISDVFKCSLVSGGSRMLKDLNCILKLYKMPYLEIFNLQNKKKIKLDFNEQFNEMWKINMINELLFMRDFNNYEILDYREINDILNYICCS